MNTKISCPYCGFKIAFGDKTKVDIFPKAPIMYLKCRKCGKEIPISFKHGA